MVYLYNNYVEGTQFKLTGEGAWQLKWGSRIQPHILECLAGGLLHFQLFKHRHLHTRIKALSYFQLLIAASTLKGKSIAVLNRNRREL